jgi:hypothetical protein
MWNGESFRARLSKYDNVDFYKSASCATIIFLLVLFEQYLIVKQGLLRAGHRDTTFFSDILGLDANHISLKRLLSGLILTIVIYSPFFISLLRYFYLNIILVAVYILIDFYLVNENNLIIAGRWQISSNSGSSLVAILTTLILTFLLVLILLSKLVGINSRAKP